jgi:hypothetical protein
MGGPVGALEGGGVAVAAGACGLAVVLSDVVAVDGIAVGRPCVVVHPTSATAMIATLDTAPKAARFFTAQVYAVDLLHRSPM